MENSFQHETYDENPSTEDKSLAIEQRENKITIGFQNQGGFQKKKLLKRRKKGAKKRLYGRIKQRKATYSQPVKNEQEETKSEIQGSAFVRSSLRECLIQCQEQVEMYETLSKDILELLKLKRKMKSVPVSRRDPRVISKALKQMMMRKRYLKFEDKQNKQSNGNLEDKKIQRKNSNSENQQQTSTNQLKPSQVIEQQVVLPSLSNYTQLQQSAYPQIRFQRDINQDGQKNYEVLNNFNEYFNTSYSNVILAKNNNELQYQQIPVIHKVYQVRDENQYTNKSCNSTKSTDSIKDIQQNSSVEIADSQVI